MPPTTLQLMTRTGPLANSLFIRKSSCTAPTSAGHGFAEHHQPRCTESSQDDPMCRRSPTPAEVHRPFIDVIQFEIRDAQITNQRGDRCQTPRGAARSV